MDYYMVEIFESSSMKFNSSWAAIIVRMAEIISESTIKNNKLLKFQSLSSFCLQYKCKIDYHLVVKKKYHLLIKKCLSASLKKEALRSIKRLKCFRFAENLVKYNFLLLNFCY